MSRLKQASRREFLRRFGYTLGAGAAASFFPQLRVMEAALAQSSGPFRALVCVYLFGGNDSFNLVVRRDATGYGIYSTSRGALAIPQGNLLPLSALDAPAGHEYGVHPNCPEIQSLFNAGRLAFLTNIGPLVRPVTKAELSNPATPRPPQLYSHNDQTNCWQLGKTNLQSTTGWGGLIGDRLFGQNAAGAVPMLLSLSGANRFQVGEQVIPFQLSAGSSNHAPSLSGFPSCTSTSLTALQQAHCAILNQANTPGAHPLEVEHARTMRRAMDLSAQFSAAIGSNWASAAPFSNFPVGSGNTYNQLADHLRLVARMLQQRSLLGHTRAAIYLVGLGGFDTHAQQVSLQPLLMQRVSQALGAFQSALDALGLSEQVLTFTMSEFGRTLNSNGDGSDHGWGGIQLVMGQPVLGQRLYGTWPDLTLNSPDCFSRGQFIPTLSVEQLGATLTRWMGIPDGQLNDIFPNLPNFPVRTIPFVNLA